jgi:hypothetical protein
LQSLEEYAVCAQDLAVYGFPGTSDDFIQIVATDAFLKGCQDKRTALAAMYNDPKNLEQILDMLTRNNTINRAILPQRYNSSRSLVRDGRCYKCDE